MSTCWPGGLRTWSIWEGKGGLSIKKVTAFDIEKALGKRHRNEFFITECKNGPTVYGNGLLQFDAVAIYKSWANPQIRGYEIKVSRSDFLRDNKYSQYLPYFHEFYFVVPRGMVQRQEVEENIGLVWYNPETGGLTTRKKAVRRDIEISVDMLLYIIMNRLDSDRLPYTSNKVEYWRDWLDNKANNRELAHRVKSKLLEQNMELLKENKRYRNFQQDREELDAITEVMKKHGLPYWRMAQTLDEALSKEYPGELDNLHQNLQNAILSIEKIKANSGG